MPEFEAPPVVEVVCGVQFDLPRLNVAHLGAFWSLLASDFPSCNEVPSILPVIEDLAERGGPIVREPKDTPRFWLISSGEDQVVQLQKDRFLFNWRRTKPEHQYPRYAFVKERFDILYGRFHEFAAGQKLPEIRPNQFELTYVNHIPPARGSWEEPSELGQVFPDFGWRRSADRFLPSPERIDFQTSFLLPRGCGRLHVRMRDTWRQSDGVRVCLLELTARGYSEDLTEWFGVAHEWIVRGFADLTDERIQRDLWREKQ